MYRFLISLRYIRRRLTAILAATAVTIGVATLLTVLSIFNGYIIRLREMIREQDAHITVRGHSPISLCGYEDIKEEIIRLEHVVGAAPILEAPAMYRSIKFNPCYLRGIEPAQEALVTGLGRFLFRPEELEEVLKSTTGPHPLDWGRKVLARPGRQPLTPEEVERLFSLEWRGEIFKHKFPDLAAKFPIPPGAMVVGSALLTGNDLELGQVVKVVTLAPRTREPVTANFVITGAFKTGNFEIDSKIFFITFKRMQDILGTFDEKEGRVCCEGIRIALDDYNNAAAVRQNIVQTLARLPEETGALDMQVRTWEDSRKNFLQAVLIEKWINGFVASLLNIFTACVVLLMLVLIVIEKTRDAGILLAMGATPWGVFSIFMWSGLIISLVGTVCGLALGFLFITFINPVHDAIYAVAGIKLFDPEVYLMDRIPAAVSFDDIAFTILPSIIFGFLASLVPAVWAARKNPIHSIQHE